MINVLHIADIHPNSNGTLGDKLVLDPKTGRSVTLTDLHRSLSYVAEVAVSARPCDLAIVAGDLFDSPHPTMDEIQIILPFLLNLSHVMPVVIITGNHDKNQSGSSATALEPLKYHHNVYVRERPDSLSLKLGDHRVRIDCLPYPSKGTLLAKDEVKGASPEQILAIINNGLRHIIDGFNIEKSPEDIKIMVAHGTVSTATVGEQPRTIANDVFIPLDLMRSYDYVALGHIHKPQRVGENGWYCGSLMRSSFGEEHEQKGFNVVELGPDEWRDVTFMENPHARTYKTIGVDYLGSTQPLEDQEMVWRLKGELTAEEYEKNKIVIDGFKALPFYSQVNIDIVKEDRRRDAHMSTVMSSDEALTHFLKDKVEESEIPIILQKHQELVQEVTA